MNTYCMKQKRVKVLSDQPVIKSICEVKYTDLVMVLETS